MAPDAKTAAAEEEEAVWHVASVAQADGCDLTRARAAKHCCAVALLVVINDGDALTDTESSAL